MVPPTLNLAVYAGDANRMEVAVETDDGPVDLTGAVVAAQCRVTADAPEVGMQAAVEDIDPVKGLVAVSWDGEQVRALIPDGEIAWYGTWDLQVTAAGERLPTTLAVGTFAAVLDVTRDLP